VTEPVPETVAAPVIGTTETIPSFVALLEPPQLVTTTLQAPATETEALVVTLLIATSSEP
jgi:hypothetical protein